MRDRATPMAIPSLMPTKKVPRKVMLITRKSRQKCFHRWMASFHSNRLRTASRIIAAKIALGK